MTSLLAMIIPAAVAYWVYTDAEKRGMNGIGWAIFTFLLLIIGLPAYLLSRKPKLIDGGMDDILDHKIDDKTV